MPIAPLRRLGDFWFRPAGGPACTHGRWELGDYTIEPSTPQGVQAFRVRRCRTCPVEFHEQVPVEEAVFDLAGRAYNQATEAVRIAGDLLAVASAIRSGKRSVSQDGVA